MGTFQIGYVSPGAKYHILQDIVIEYKRACSLHALWPTDPLHAMAVIQEEVGEAQKAMLEAVYEPHKKVDFHEGVRRELVQAGAMILRFLVALDNGEVNPAVAPQVLLRETD